MTTLNPPFKAKDMKSLYSKVVKGNYPEIPFHYSKDLGTIIAMCLRVSATARPSAEQLLKTREMKQKILFYEFETDNEENINPNKPQDQLLQTIKISDQMQNIRLPKAKYLETRSTKRSQSHD